MRASVLVLLGTLVACGRSGEGLAPSGSAAETATVPQPAEPLWRSVKYSAPAPLASMAKEVPELEKELGGLIDMKTLWTDDQAAPRRLLLTAVSSALQRGGFVGKLRDTLNEPAHANTKRAAVLLFSILARQPTLPSAFMDGLDAHLVAIQGEPNHGVWSATDPLWDFAALAAWMRQNDLLYLRELIASRAGPRASEWSLASQHKFLRSEQQTWFWMSRIKPLSEVDKTRLRELSTTQPKQTFVLKGLAISVDTVDVVGALGSTAAALGSKIVVARMSVQNTGQAPASRDCTIAIVDASDRTFTSSLALTTAAKLDDIMKGVRYPNELQPGVVSKDVVAFEVPETVLAGSWLLTFLDSDENLMQVEMAGKK